MINKDRIREWVEALRSGKYKQGSYGLKSEDCDSYVGCDISELGVWDGEFYSNEEFTEWGLLPILVSNYYGLESGDPYVTYKGKKHTLSCLNDDFDLSFDEIADLIEKEYLS